MQARFILNRELLAHVFYACALARVLKMKWDLGFFHASALLSTPLFVYCQNKCEKTLASSFSLCDMKVPLMQMSFSLETGPEKTKDLSKAVPEGGIPEVRGS